MADLGTITTYKRLNYNCPFTIYKQPIGKALAQPYSGNHIIAAPITVTKNYLMYYNQFSSGWAGIVKRSPQTIYRDSVLDNKIYKIDKGKEIFNRPSFLNKTFSSKPPIFHQYTNSPFYRHSVYKLEGILQVEGVAVSGYLVRLYKRDTGAMLGAAITSAGGYFIFNNLSEGPKNYFVVGFDSSLVPIYNAQIFDLLTPVPMG